MSQEFYSGSFGGEAGKPPRVEILRGTGGKNPYFKKGQFGYVVGVNTSGGQWLVDKEDPTESKPGEVAFLVSKTPDMRGGALWFSADALRFTKAPTDPVRALSDEEKVALDLFLANGANGNGMHKKEIAELVPDTKRRSYVKMIAAQVKSLRARER